MSSYLQNLIDMSDCCICSAFGSYLHTARTIYLKFLCPAFWYLFVERNGKIFLRDREVLGRDFGVLPLFSRHYYFRLEYLLVWLDSFLRPSFCMLSCIFFFSCFSMKVLFLIKKKKSTHHMSRLGFEFIYSCCFGDAWCAVF